MTKYADIIARLEKATGPDRWLDARIDAALRVGSPKMRGTGYQWAWDNFPTWQIRPNVAGMCGVLHDTGDLGLIWDSEAFTASIDAAIALVRRFLPGWVCETLSQDATGALGEMRAIGWTAEFSNGLQSIQGQSTSLPIAILIALFRALDESEAE